ncbi:DUF4145 domain-containing protein [Pseudochryseolinea flava]|uniref:DUF4145 domain-containing protein n=1 Tax=Pseudochryseolinea flava TaxID=2059302 RepID=A0A364Y4Y3_9BACT|nr:DUF4145 domain-containing protein [Pseudochryseolinea flava]RAW01101.1 hypothetical protein DQQ10_12800 [Pseudochryseolinea flava]
MKAKDWVFNDFTSQPPKHWRCPSCNGGLILEASKLQREETTESKATKHKYSPAYAGIIQCFSCKEVIAITGVASDGDYTNKIGDNEYETIEYISYSPRHFIPALHLFEIPKACPKEIRNEIIKAFGYYFGDTSACANRIRVALEFILTDQGVQKTVVNIKRKRESIKLHARIEMFKKDDKSFSKTRSKLLAIKWIGNDGSHVGKTLTQNDILTAFDLLEYVLENLYGDREKRLTKVASDVNKKRGIVAKRKRKKEF